MGCKAIEQTTTTTIQYLYKRFLLPLSGNLSLYCIHTHTTPYYRCPVTKLVLYSYHTTAYYRCPVTVIVLYSYTQLRLPTNGDCHSTVFVHMTTYYRWTTTICTVFIHATIYYWWLPLRSIHTTWLLNTSDYHCTVFIQMTAYNQ
jgi:hypothetical protein